MRLRRSTSNRSATTLFRDNRDLRPARSYSRALGFAGRRYRLFQAMEPDQEWVFARPRSASQINEQGRQARERHLGNVDTGSTRFEMTPTLNVMSTISISIQ